MKLILDNLALRLTHEGIANFAFLPDFDKKRIQHLPNICNNSIPVVDADTSNNIGSEAAVSGENVHSFSVSILATTVNDAKHYGSIARFMSPHNASYSIVLAIFKVEYESHLSF